MNLLGESYQYGRIVFTLTNTPIELILDDVRQTAWKYYKNEQRTLTGADFRSFMEDFPVIDDYINFNEDFTFIMRGNHSYNSFIYSARCVYFYCYFCHFFIF